MFASTPFNIKRSILYGLLHQQLRVPTRIKIRIGRCAATVLLLALSFATRPADAATSVFGFNPTTVSAGPSGGTGPNYPTNGTVTINGSSLTVGDTIVFDGIVANVNGITGDNWGSINFNAGGFVGLTGAMRFQVPSSSSIYDWSTGAAGAAITASGGMVVSFNWTSADNTSANWISYCVGMSPGVDQSLQIVKSTTASGILLRNSGGAQVFKTGTGGATGTFGVTSTSHLVTLYYYFTSWASGTPVTLNAYVDGNLVLTQAFTWIQSGGVQNMAISSVANGTVIDNFSVTTLPPTPLSISQDTTSDSPATNYVGRTINLSAALGGSAPINYQWKVNTGSGFVSIANATNSTVTLANVQISNSGIYELFATNAAGSTNTSPLTVTVVTGPANDNLVNLQFTGFTGGGTPAVTQTGNAVIGTAGDLWNTVFSTVGSFTAGTGLTASNSTPIFLNDSSSKGTAISLNYVVDYLYNAGAGVFASSPVAGLMSGVAAMQNGRTGTLTLSNLAAGNYDLYIYGQNSSSQTRSSSYSANGLSAVCGPNSSDNALTSPNNYVHLVPTVTSSGVLTITMTGVADGNSQINGFQLSGPLSVPTLALAQDTIITPTNGVYAGYSNVTLTASFGGTSPITNQWEVDTGSGFVPITGATNTTLTLTNVQFSNAGSYALFASNRAGSASSTPLTLNVVPLILSADTTATPLTNVYVGYSNITLTASIIGAAPLTNQWKVDTGSGFVPITGATNTTLTLTNLQLANLGNYALFVANAYGTSNSTPLTLTVLAAPSALSVNVQFIGSSFLNGNAPTQSGAAVIGNGGDVWNVVSNPTGGTAPAGLARGTNLTLVDVGSIGTTVTMDYVADYVFNGTGFGNSNPFKNVASPYANLMSGYMGSVSQGSTADTNTITLHNLTPGSYDLYFYVCGRTDGQTRVDVLSANGQSSVCGPNSGNYSLISGVNYVHLTPTVTSNCLLNISFYGTADSGQGLLNGFQLNGPVTLPTLSLSSDTTSDSPANDYVGRSVTFSASFAGYPTPALQWEVDNGSGYVNVPNATNSTLTLASVQTTNTGNYALFATNLAGSLNSTPLSLTIVPLPANNLAVNVQFVGTSRGSGFADTQTGPAVIGNGGDWWNPVTNPNPVGGDTNPISGSVLGLADATDIGTSIALSYTGNTILNSGTGTPFHSSGSPAANLMEACLGVANTRTATVTLQNLQPGTYDLYLYSSADNSLQSEVSQFAANDSVNNLAGPNSANNVLTLGTNYVHLTPTVNSNGVLNVSFVGNVTGLASLNGLQLNGPGAVPLPTTAAFTGSPTNGNAPLAVTFINASSGSVTNSVWNFGDGHTATNNSSASVTNTYAAPGTYTVTLTVTGTGGASAATNTAYIVVASLPSPVAGFTGTPTNGFAPLLVAFTDASTGTGLTNWVWNFGDGNSVTNSSNTTVSHSYANAGTYMVSLTVSGAGGSNTNTQSGYIVTKPTPTFSSPVLSGGSLILSGTNGPVGVQYRILTTTNLTLPLASWIPIWTNVFAADGSYSYTNSPLSNNASFFQLVSP